MKFENEGVLIAYDETGTSGTEALVLLHGLGSARSTWKPLVPELARGRRVLAVDHRGHGESSHVAGTYTLEHYVSDATASCDQVASVPVTFVGHSLGGVVAVTVAATRPELVRAVFAEDPPLYTVDRADDANRFAAMFDMIHRVVAEMQSRDAPLEEYESMLAAAPSPNGKGSFAEVLGEAGTAARARGLASLDPGVFVPAVDGTGLVGAARQVPFSCPVLVLRADPALGAALSERDEDRFRIVNPHAQVEMVEGASHFIHDEQPELFSTRLEEFLESL